MARTNRETEALTIDLVQPWWVVDDVRERDLWNETSLAGHVERSRADLVVLPECYPFYPDIEEGRPRRGAPWMTVEEGQRALLGLATRTRRAIVAGGLFTQGPTRRNASIFAAPPDVSSVYCKRILWKKEKRLVDAAEMSDDAPFEVRGHRVIPLICSDVFGDSMASAERPTAEMSRLVDQTSKLAQDHARSIVLVTSYAHAPMGWRWTRRLQDLAEKAGRPVLYCNFAGSDENEFGGGGSGVFLPGGSAFRLGNTAAALRVTIELSDGDLGSDRGVTAQIV